MSDRPKRQPLPVIAYEVPTRGNRELIYAEWFHKYGNTLPDGSVPLSDYAEAEAGLDLLDAMVDIAMSTVALQRVTIEALNACIAQLEAECLEQARIVGMGAERELSLRAKVEETGRVADKLSPLVAVLLREGLAAEALVVDEVFKALKPAYQAGQSTPEHAAVGRDGEA